MSANNKDALSYDDNDIQLHFQKHLVGVRKDFEKTLTKYKLKRDE